MPRYFFDFHNGNFYLDEVGVDCADFEAARVEAMRTLPEIATFAIPQDGDTQSFTVMVREQSGAVVYTGTLTYAGLRMNGRA